MRHLRHAVLRRDGAGLTDAQLIGCFIEHRDEAAFAALVDRHGAMVWGVCRRLLDHQDAEDAFQSAFLVLSRKAATILPREMVANWLYGVARQTALLARRTVARRQVRERQVAHMPEPGVVPRDTWDDLRPLLDNELGRLPDKYRAVIVLCDLEGKTRTEAARQLGCPEGTVAGWLARARTMLAGRLTKRGVVLSGGSLAAILSQQAAACVPGSVVISTIAAATAFAAGHTVAAGAISAQVAVLTDGVLKAMLMTKLKIATAVLLVVSIIAIPASGLAYRAFAEDGPDTKQQQAVRSDPPAKGQGAAEKELPRLEAEVKRLQTDIEGLKKRMQGQAREGKAGESKLVIKVYPVKGLTNEEQEGKEAQPLMRVIANTIEPASWCEMGGDGSMEYLNVADSLVIRQSPDIQKQVQDLLESLRKTKTEQVPKPAEGGM